MSKEKLVELDGRQSGDIYYQLVCHLGSMGLGIIARSPHGTRAIPVPADKGNDAITHPEVYLSSDEVIYTVD